MAWEMENFELYPLCDREALIVLIFNSVGVGLSPQRCLRVVGPD